LSAAANLLLWGPLLLLGSAFAYQAWIALHGFRVKRGARAEGEPIFGIVVPAHNEEGGIEALLASLRALDYPQDRVAVVVVADHCTDATARLVREAGYACLERRSGARGKAPSLADGVAWVLERRPDLAAIAFFDADNTVQADFFRVVAGLVPHEPYLQGNVGIQNWNATVFSRLNYINAMSENRFRELARSQAGLSCHLRGHGMVFRRDILGDLAWQEGGLVEDYDMQLRIAIGGRRVVWVDDARVRSVLPETARAATVQRMRWAGGKSAIMRRGVSMLWRAWMEKRSMVVLDQILLLLIPSHAIQVCLALFLFATSLILAGPGSVLFCASASLLAGYIGYIVAGALLNRVPPAAFLSVPLAPFFILWRTWIHLASLKGPGRWK
jgi:cellulose synthase/poly-beta-1,6-N-acetylglucosamine synthase-like glycosyltransferase